MRGRSAAPCNCGSKITTAAALVPNTRTASWKISPGSASSLTARRFGSPIACARYAAALASLSDRGLTYWCDCSRQTVRAEGGTVGGELRYSGRCRDRRLGPGGDRGVRVRLDEGDERFDDGRLGPQVQQPSAQCGDLLARDRHGQWTYQFAVTVDDMQDGVDLVVRGMDLLPSTGRQIALARLLGRPRPPVFVHHPLILAASGEKLSKSNRDVGLAALRADGVSPEEAIGRAAAAIGLIESPRTVPNE